MPAPITIDPNSPPFISIDEVANALAATFPNKGSETAGMIYKDADGKYRYSTTVPGGENFNLQAAVPKGSSLAAIVHSHPGKDALGQVFSPSDLDTANQLKLPSYVRFMDANDTRVYRPGVTKTQTMKMSSADRYGKTVARGDALTLPPQVDPVKAQIAQLLTKPP